MIEVTKSIYLFPDGTKMINKKQFMVRDMKELERLRMMIKKSKGCERVKFNYMEIVEEENL